MTPFNSRPLRQTPAPANQAPCPAASQLARFARDRFWAARLAGDRPAMIRWSVRENALRRGAHGVAATSPLPAQTSAAA